MVGDVAWVFLFCCEEDSTWFIALSPSYTLRCRRVCLRSALSRVRIPLPRSIFRRLGSSKLVYARGGPPQSVFGERLLLTQGGAINGPPQARRAVGLASRAPHYINFKSGLPGDVVKRPHCFAVLTPTARTSTNALTLLFSLLRAACLRSEASAADAAFISATRHPTCRASPTSIAQESVYSSRHGCLSHVLMCGR